MKKTVNFDVDGTLITFKGNPRKKVISMLHDFQGKGHKITVWSRSGKRHAEITGAQLGLKNVTYKSKNDSHATPDVAVDDKENMGKKNIRV